MSNIEWIEYKSGGNFVPVDSWGSDHWSTLAYLETRAVDADGRVENQRMRCNPRIHRSFANLGKGGGLVDGSKYPTRLRGNKTLDDHDDWSCLEDMVSAGLLRAFWCDGGDQIFGGAEARIELTDLGFEICAALRSHKAKGGNFGDFEPPRQVEDSGAS